MEILVAYDGDEGGWRHYNVQASIAWWEEGSEPDDLLGSFLQLRVMDGSATDAATAGGFRDVYYAGTNGDYWSFCDSRKEASQFIAMADKHRFHSSGADVAVSEMMRVEEPFASDESLFGMRCGVVTQNVVNAMWADALRGQMSEDCEIYARNAVNKEMQRLERIATRKSASK